MQLGDKNNIARGLQDKTVMRETCGNVQAKRTVYETRLRNREMLRNKVGKIKGIASCKAKIKCPEGNKKQ